MNTHLRSIDEHDLELLYEWYDDPQLYQNLVGDYQHYPRSDAINYMRENWLDSKQTRRCIIQHNSKNIGLVALSNICKTTYSASIDIFIKDANLRGKHIGRSALSQMLETGFFEIGLKNIYLNVLERNEMAIRMYKALGFHTIPEKKTCTIKNGEKLNVIKMALSKEQHIGRPLKNDN